MSLRRSSAFVMPFARAIFSNASPKGRGTSVLTWTIGDRLLVTIGARMIYAPPKRSSVLSHRNGRFGSVVNAIQHGQSTVCPMAWWCPTSTRAACADSAVRSLRPQTPACRDGRWQSKTSADLTALAGRRGACQCPSLFSHTATWICLCRARAAMCWMSRASGSRPPAIASSMRRLARSRCGCMDQMCEFSRII